MVGSGPLMPGPGTSAPGTCVLRTSLPSFTPVCSRGWSSCGKNPLTQEKPRERSEECVSGSGEDWWRPVVTSRDPQRTTTPGELRRCGSPCAGLRGRGPGRVGGGCPCSSEPECSLLFSHPMPLTGAPGAQPGPPPRPPNLRAALELQVGGSSGPGHPPQLIRTQD